jgi:hypothetical protein
MSFLLFFMFSLQQNQRTRGQNRFCLEAGKKVGRMVGRGLRMGVGGGRGDPNDLYTYE